MPKINVYLPDELAEAVRETGLPVSAICQRALEQAVRRVTAIRETSLGELSSGDLEERFPLMTGRTRTVLALAVERARASAARAAAAGTGAASPAPSGDVIGSATSALVADTTDAVASAFVKDATDAVASAFVDDATDSVASTLVADATKVAGSASIAVGTGDLLGAMIQEGGNLALHVLRALEVEPSALLRELDRDGVAEPPAPATASTSAFRRPARWSFRSPRRPGSGTTMWAASTCCSAWSANPTARPAGSCARPARSRG
ncbi:Clp domain protein [Actinoplanes sp. SE50/110]|uniref:hypothetical protein n=1 Tax=Actinoplanes sp. (strain ATCC 31044 / CBS 674.73 / SE50/110) TaxID=134676 RepID=UPI00023ECD88|nr:hypothetical protein [Actinoplanes sp. SE50/110]AEV87731.1 Clp domain protein [Actinoplanes sp. SE50/110]